MGKLDGRRPLRKPRRRWGDNIKIVLEKYNLSVYTGFILVRIGTRMGNIAKF